MTWRFVFDPSQSGLRKVLKEHEELALRYFWDEGAEDVVSKQVWTYVSGKLGEGRAISRATIIQLMKVMDELGILESREASGKGGRYTRYTAKMDEKEFQRYIARTIINSLMRDFPQITTKVLKELLS
ncbi:MAG: BlaI/MecI/CopY family transcriptional regulator [Candidatus Hodarchaeota archaeon]